MEKREESKEETEWYFAIGSMCNPISLKNRGLTPVESHPAIAHGYEVKFVGSMGMATAAKVESATCNGVLHLMTKSQMLILDKIESGYERVPADCELYDGSQCKGTIYSFSKDKKIFGKTYEQILQETKLPTERYIDIIVRGMTHYGVHQSHIEFLKKHGVQPRKKLSEFDKFTVPEGAPTYTLEDVTKMNGQDGIFGYAVNDKVLQMLHESPPYLERMKDFFGIDGTLRFAKLLYEPLYPVVDDRDSMGAEHLAWVEDLTFNFSQMSGRLDKEGNEHKDEPGVKVIGWYKHVKQQKS